MVHSLARSTNAPIAPIALCALVALGACNGLTGAGDLTTSDCATCGGAALDKITRGEPYDLPSS